MTNHFQKFGTCLTVLSHSVQSYTLSDSMFGISTGVLTNNVLPLSLYLKSTLDYETGGSQGSLSFWALNAIYIVHDYYVLLFSNFWNVPLFPGPHSYNLTITARDTDHASTQLLVIVNVIDENDHKWVFPSKC